MARPHNTKDNENRKFVDSPTRLNQSAVETVVTNTVSTKVVDPFGSYDKILVTYPESNTEVYTYSLSDVDIGSITVTYKTNKKKILESVVYNEL